MARNIRKKTVLVRQADGAVLNVDTGQTLMARSKTSDAAAACDGEGSQVNFEDSRLSARSKPEMVFTADLSFSGHMPEIEKVVKIFQWATTQTPARLTIRQLFAFVLFAQADVSGHPMTMKDLSQVGILDIDHNDVFTTTNANARSFEMFFHQDETKDGFGLNWMYRQRDDFDARVIYFRLTEGGKAAYRELTMILSDERTERMMTALKDQLDDEAKMKLVMVEEEFERYFRV